jgi:L-threonylcarbamoyladenylate synthase
MTSWTILKIDRLRPDEQTIESAARILGNGGVVVAPTETRYGLLGRIDDMHVVERIFELKNRTLNLPTAIFVRSRDELFRFGHQNRLAELLSERFLPGPLTLVLLSKSKYPAPIVVNDRIGLRQSSSPVVSGVLESSGLTLTATSANVSGRKEPETITEIAAIFGAGVDLYLDCGPLTTLPSTVVNCSGETIEILRKGAIEESEIREAAAEVG